MALDRTKLVFIKRLDRFMIREQELKLSAYVLKSNYKTTFLQTRSYLLGTLKNQKVAANLHSSLEYLYHSFHRLITSNYHTPKD
jgi:hypothetical protein